MRGYSWGRGMTNAATIKDRAFGPTLDALRTGLIANRETKLVSREAPSFVTPMHSGARLLARA
jgi:hypothetical protein